MIKKLIILVAAIMPLLAAAQAEAWKVHPRFVAASTQCLADAGNKVYYLVAGNVFCYDKQTQETVALGTNTLNDLTVTKMFYNENKGYLLLAYDNSNIDIITADGRVVNIPEIKNAVVTQTKAINSVTFDDSHAFVAADFGFIVIDDSKFVVTESHYYGNKMTGAAHVGDKLIVGIDTGLKYCNFDDLREKAGSFRALTDGGKSVYLLDLEIYPIDDTHFFLNSRSSFEVCTLDGATITRTVLTPNHAVTVQRTPTGFVACFPSINNYLTTDATGENAQLHSCNGEFISINPHGDGTVWALNGTGLHKQGEAGQRPDAGIGINTTAFWTAYSPGEGKLYLASTTDNALLPSANKGAKTEIWNYDGVKWQDVTPPNVPLYSNGADTYQGNYWLTFIPGTTNTYVTALRAAGTIKVVDGKVVTSYVNGKTTPLNDKYKPTPALDSEGNLWLAQSYKSSTKSVAVLPRDKFLSATAPVPGDWYVSNIPGMDVSAFKASSFVISKGTDIKVFSSGAFGKAVFMWNNKGDITNTNPDKISFSQFKSTDYKAIKWDYVFTLNAMSDGEVWMGYDAGAIKFDPSHAWDPDFRVARILLPVDGLQVNALCEEPDGTKWVGTNMDGIYHMSADGTQVLKHFNTDNSVLQSNQIYSMCYYPDNKSLVIVTSNGVVEYFSDASAEVGEDSKVIVTPNPVRPDFTGFVTVMGLKNDAQVAITDATGRAWYESTATAGKCEWDCCDSNGARVPAGNYTVVVNGTAAATFLVLK